MPRSPSPYRPRRAGVRADARRARRTGRTRRTARQGAARRRLGTADAARARLRGFRQASMVAVAFTGLLLLVFAPQEVGIAQDAAAAADTLAGLPDTVAVIRQVPLEALPAAAEAEIPPDSAIRQATQEATGTLRQLWSDFVANSPKYGIALAILLVAWAVTRLLRLALQRLLHHWERATALAAMTNIVLWLMAAGIALSVLVGDIRALVGSLGLVGLALSWALQTPIESFTGWLLNSLKGYYRIGDRIAVGEVFGDVYRIDFLTTTVWEYGGPDRPPGFVRAEQPTGRLITFPNNEIVTGTIINYTRDFPYVWSELAVAVALESELAYAIEVMQRVAERVLGEEMREPARRYAAILRTARLEMTVPEGPQVFVSLNDWAVNLTIRYLVGARAKRLWASELTREVTEELNRKEHAGRILPVYPRQQIQFIHPDGTAAPPGWVVE